MKRVKDASVDSNEGHVVNHGGLAETLLSLDRRMGMLSEKLDSIEQQLGFVLLTFEQPDNVLEEDVTAYSSALVDATSTL